MEDREVTLEEIQKDQEPEAMSHQLKARDFTTHRAPSRVPTVTEQLFGKCLGCKWKGNYYQTFFVRKSGNEYTLICRRCKAANGNLIDLTPRFIPS